MANFKWSTLYALVFLNIYSVSSTEITVLGPHEAFTGDYEKYSCEMEGDDVTSNYGLEWKFKLKSGELVGMNDSDIMTALEIRNFTPGNLTVMSFLRIDNADVVSVACQHSPKIVGFWDVIVKDLTAISTENDPCTKANESGKPITSVFVPSMDMLTPSYRKSHYIGDEYLSLTYGMDVTQIKVVCHSPSTEDPRWSIKNEVLSKMKFAVWTVRHQSCKQQILHIYQVAGEHGQTTKLSLDCTTNGPYSSKVNLGFDFPATRAGGGEMDYNVTESCINDIVEQFYNKELTGVSVGGSFVIILMMVGMAVMKRQLNQQQNNNRGKNPVENTPNGRSSTEHLSPNENGHSNSNGNNYP